VESRCLGFKLLILHRLLSCDPSRPWVSGSTMRRVWDLQEQFLSFVQRGGDRQARNAHLWVGENGPEHD